MATVSQKALAKSDVFILSSVLAIIIGSVFAYHYFSHYSALYRVIGLLMVIALSLALGYQTQVGKRVWVFAQDARQEIRKVVWPSRPETLQTTALVLVMVLIMGILLWMVDGVLLRLIGLITGHGGATS